MISTAVVNAIDERSTDCETPTGPAEEQMSPRSGRPAFSYRGYGDAHWRGQLCHVLAATSMDERLVVMACGCRTTVAWWTLEPLATDTRTDGCRT